MKPSFFIAAILAISFLAAFSLGEPTNVNAQGAQNIFTVNSTGNSPDSDTADGVCDFDMSTPGLQCTLRAAIHQANSTVAQDAIIFDIPPGSDPGCDSNTGVCTIRPTSISQLPTIFQPVIIDGYTQPGASHNTLSVGTDAKLKIVLDGSNAGSAHGLDITSGNSVVMGLVINRFNGIGIILNGNEQNRIQGNLIGTGPDGSIAVPNSRAVV